MDRLLIPSTSHPSKKYWSPPPPTVWYYFSITQGICLSSHIDWLVYILHPVFVLERTKTSFFKLSQVPHKTIQMNVYVSLGLQFNTHVFLKRFERHSPQVKAVFSV